MAGMLRTPITVETKKGSTTLEVTMDALVIAGWAGRDRVAMEHHIAELEAIGVPRPATTPTFYRVSASRVTFQPSIEVMGDNSSGEAETVLFAHKGKLLVGLGSDHTDRKVETYGVTASKQICEKPVAPVFWQFEDVADHWDELILRSHTTSNGQCRLYQEGSVSGLLHPRDLIVKYTGHEMLPEGTMMFCGTLPAIGGIRIGSAFQATLEDPVLSRKLDLRYSIKTLAVAG